MVWMDSKNRKSSNRSESRACMCSEELAEELEDVDLADDEDDEDGGWETEDEMESEQDDSDLSFSKHTGDSPQRLREHFV